jgi:5-methylcytosine-specific restriction endonuclease McrA
MASGEQLFRYVRDEVVPATSRPEVWHGLGETVNTIGNSEHFERYFRGAIALYAVRRLKRFWDEEGAPPENTRVRRVAKYVREEVFLGTPEDVTNRLARMFVKAYDASDRRINASTRQTVIEERTPIACYLCGFVLDRDAPDGHAQLVTIEHLWPSSLGGESDARNLLPACVRCQQRKSDSLSWEWWNIHNLVLPYAPDNECLTSVSWEARIASHYFTVMQWCEEEGHTLKDGFVRIGPVAGVPRFEGRGAPISFFDLRTAREMNGD